MKIKGERGALLEVSATEHRDAVIAFIEAKGARMQRSTVRCAIEKLDKPLQQRIIKRLPKG